LTNIKQVYNARHKFRKSDRDDKLEMQHLVAKLNEQKYVNLTRIKCQSIIVNDIFRLIPIY